MSFSLLKRITQVSLSVVLFLLYIALWIAIANFCVIADINGMFYVFVDAWGEWSVYSGLLIALTVLLSPLVLWLLLKRESINKGIFIPVISIFLTVVFVIFSFSAFYISAEQFRVFSEEKWQDYPRQRYIMLDDLKNRYGIVGMNNNQIFDLLGKPDEISYYNTWIYNCEYCFIEIYFNDNNEAVSIELH